jgi:hypothetical protein
MRKKILHILTFLFVSLVMLTGCGSSNNKGKVPLLLPEEVAPQTGYAFFNATTPLIVNQADTEYDIKVQLLKNGFVAPGQEVVLKPFDSKYGKVSNFKATTGSDGYAIFAYTSPTPLLPDGTVSDPLTIIFTDTNGATIKQEIILKFGASITPPVDTKGMVLTAAPTVINIADAGESVAISLYLSNIRGPVTNTDIKAKFFDPNGGTLDSYSVLTNANGQAVFNYTAPASLPASGITITFEVENGNPALTETVAVKFGGATSPIDTSAMALTAAPTEINIATAGESAVISIYLSNIINNNPIADTMIKANFFDPNSGTLNSYSVPTNANGQAVFNYTAPASLPASSITITFEVENGDPKLAINVPVKFGGSGTPPVDTKGMSLQAAPTEINIAKTGENAGINLFLSNSSGPVVNTPIKANWFDPNSGTLNSYSVVTDTSGKAVFDYTAPATLPASDVTITFEVENGSPLLTEAVVVKFISGGDDVVADMYISPQSFTITVPNEKKEISIVTVNAENIGISAKVQIEQPNNGTDYGQFDKTNVTTDSNGYATVEYTAPSSISGLTERNITFTELSQGLTRELNMKFNTSTGPGTEYEIEVIVPTSLSVESIDQITVIIHELGNDTATIDDDDVLEVNLTSLIRNLLTFGGSPTTTYSDAAVKPISVTSSTLSWTAVHDITA